LAFALRRNGQQFFFFAGIFAWASLVSVFAVGSVGGIFAGVSSRAGRAALASTASAGFGVSSLPGHTHESAEWRFWAFARASAVALVDVQHLFPHIARASLAEFHFTLHAGLQGLNVVEDQGEGQQAGGDGHRAEDDRDEGDDPQRGIGVHFGLFHLFVFTHC